MKHTKTQREWCRHWNQQMPSEDELREATDPDVGERLEQEADEATESLIKMVKDLNG